jgi:hypothetical protein
MHCPVDDSRQSGHVGRRRQVPPLRRSEDEGWDAERDAAGGRVGCSRSCSSDEMRWRIDRSSAAIRARKLPAVCFMG